MIDDTLTEEQKRIILEYMQGNHLLMSRVSQAFDTLGEDIVGYMFQKGGGEPDIGFYSRQEFLKTTASLSELKGMSDVLGRIEASSAINMLDPSAGNQCGFWLVFFFEGCDTPYCGAFGVRRMNARGGSA